MHSLQNCSNKTLLKNPITNLQIQQSSSGIIGQQQHKPCQQSHLKNHRDIEKTLTHCVGDSQTKVEVAVVAGRR